MRFIKKWNVFDFKLNSLLFVIALLYLSQLQGQLNCNQIISQANDQYRYGEFTILKESLKRCTKPGRNNSDQNRINAHGYLALIAIAEDADAVALDNIEKTLDIDFDFTFEPGQQNIIYRNLLALQKRKLKKDKNFIVSISRKEEDIETIPNAFEIITASEIEDRGYMDLIDLLSDLPGFEISKTYSVLYANVYQMGYRQTNTERTLFMIDGVEENDLWLNWAFLSRQYPLSNIKQVEIIYGPASTIYGSGAFVGTINIVTYSDGEKPGREKDGFNKSKMYYRGSLSGGSFNTKDFDFTLGSANDDDSKVNFQISGRYFTSDEHDMSSLPFHNYDSDDFDSRFKYDHFTHPVSLATELPTNYANYTESVNDTLVLNALGNQMALALDKAAYNRNVNGSPMGFSNHSENMFIGARLDFKNFALGFRTWKRTEGFNTLYQDIFVAPSRNGTVWSPENQTLFITYSNALSENLNISILTTFKSHKLGRQSNRVDFKPLANPSTSFTLAHVLNMFNDGYNPAVENSDYENHGWANKFYFYQALQGRGDARIYYEKNNIQFTFGGDYRIKSTQGDYLYVNTKDTFFSSPTAYSNSLDGINIQSTGTNPNVPDGNNMFLVKNYGAYLQSGYNLKNKIFLNAGIRFDVHQTRTSYDLKSLSPRLGVVYKQGEKLFKLNYSSGFQAASLFTRYSTGGGRVVNTEGFLPEKINYIDVSILGKSLKSALNWQFTGFGYQVRNAIELGETAEGKNQFINIDGTYNIYGAMASVSYGKKNLRVNLNGTYFSTPTERLQTTDKEIKDVAAYRANLGITYKYEAGNTFFVQSNLRANYVGSKSVLVDDLVNFNPAEYPGGLVSIPQYVVLNGNFILGHKAFPNVKLGITTNNILNATYYHPGVRSASGYFDLFENSADVNSDYSQWYSQSAVAKNPVKSLQRPRYFIFKLLFDF